MNNEYLLKPIKIGNRTAENRLVINAMECCDSDEQGNPGEKTYRRYQRYFEGSAGVIVLEAITVTYESRARKTQLGIEPRNQKALEKFTQKMKEVNNKPLFIWQLTASGELSHPDFSRRVCVKPLYGFDGDVIDEDYIDKTIAIGIYCWTAVVA